MMVSMIYSSSRLIYAIGRDGLLPSFLGKLDKKSHSPQVALWIVAIIIAIMGGLVSLDQLTSLVNIGTLFAFHARFIWELFRFVSERISVIVEALRCLSTLCFNSFWSRLPWHDDPVAKRNIYWSSNLVWNRNYHLLHLRLLAQ